MNLLKLFIISAFLLVLSGCKDDDPLPEPECTQADWLGTYVGTRSCETVLGADVTITILASGSNDIIVSWETSDDSGEYEPFTPNICVIDYSSPDLGLTLTMDATLDGDNIEFSGISQTSSEYFTCNMSVVRQ